MSETIDAEVVNPQALAIRPPQEVAPPGLFGDEPSAVIAKATAIANSLKAVIRSQGLISKISGKEYPKCEAWTLLGTMIGVFPVLAWSRPVEGGWEARVEAKTRDGSIVGAAEAQCLRGERNWANRDDFALRSMAQTRATSKCLRMPLGFVMTLAGFQPTPAEEMNSDQPAEAPPRSSPPARPPAAAAPPRQAAPAPAAATSSAPTPSGEPRYAGPKARAWMIEKLNGIEAQALEYFRALELPAVLMPNEGLEQLPVEWIPLDGKQLALMKAAIEDYADGNKAVHPYAPNPLPPLPAKPKAAAKPAPAAAPAPAPAASAAKRAADWFWPIILTVPRKGMKKADYMRAPDTILSLYTAMKSGDEAAKFRLWGLAKEWSPSPYEWNGKTYNPTEADHTSREALDAFVDWEEKHGSDTEPPEDEDRSAIDQ